MITLYWTVFWILGALNLILLFPPAKLFFASITLGLSIRVHLVLLNGFVVLLCLLPAALLPPFGILLSLAALFIVFVLPGLLARLLAPKDLPDEGQPPIRVTDVRGVEIRLEREKPTLISDTGYHFSGRVDGLAKVLLYNNALEWVRYQEREDRGFVELLLDEDKIAKGITRNVFITRQSQYDQPDLRVVFSGRGEVFRRIGFGRLWTPAHRHFRVRVYDVRDDNRLVLDQSQWVRMHAARFAYLRPDLDLPFSWAANCVALPALDLDESFEALGFEGAPGRSTYNFKKNQHVQVNQDHLYP